MTADGYAWRLAMVLCASADWVSLGDTYGADTLIIIDDVDPYKKPHGFLAVYPKGLVPAFNLTAHDPPKALNENTVLLEYLEEVRYVFQERACCYR